jgi:hypothetical protein
MTHPEVVIAHSVPPSSLPFYAKKAAKVQVSYQTHLRAREHQLQQLRMLG